MILYIIIIVVLLVVAILLSIALVRITKNMVYLTEKEKDFINFTIDIYINFGEELGVESKEEHDRLVEILKKIQDKHLK